VYSKNKNEGAFIPQATGGEITLFGKILIFLEDQNEKGGIVLCVSF